jgi:hypothetical protein
MLPAGNDTRNIAREFAIRAMPTQSSIIAKYTGFRLKRKTPVLTRVVVGFLTSKAVRALVNSRAAAVTSSTAAMINAIYPAAPPRLAEQPPLEKKNRLRNPHRLPLRELTAVALQRLPYLSYPAAIVSCGNEHQKIKRIFLPGEPL